jgi:hypothetical protein
LGTALLGGTVITRQLLCLRSRGSCGGRVMRGWRRMAALMLGFAVLGGSVQASAQVLKPSLLPDNVLLANPLSGLYGEVTIANKTRRFQPANPRFVDTAPVAGGVLNLYGRLSWDLLEPAEGQYDFSGLDDVLRPCPAPQGVLTCLPPGVKFGFRIMAFNPQTKGDTNVSAGSDGFPVYSDLPAYLTVPQHGWLLPVNVQDVTQGHYFIPDWNDPFFLARVKALLTALGAKYNGDQRLGWVDIGIYGSWGEWHTVGLPDRADYRRGIPYNPAAPFYQLNTQQYAQNTNVQGAYVAGTMATKDAIIDDYNAAFPDTLLLSLTDDAEGLCHALTLPGSATHIGLRRDSLGSATGWTAHFPDNPAGCNSAQDQAMLLARWRSAPFITETFGNGSSPLFPCQTFETDAAGNYEIAEQVKDFHIAAIKNGSMCKGTWDDLTPVEQQAFLTAGVRVGYRLAPARLDVSVESAAGGRRMVIAAQWTNAGVTPDYDVWRAEYSLWPDQGSTPVVVFVSKADLRKILPGSMTVIDEVALPTWLAAGRYQLRVRMTDPRGYMAPLRLALEGRLDGGYYGLGVVNVPER